MDVFGLGNALVDALVVLDERELLERHSLKRGTMHLVDEGRWEGVYGEVPRESVELAPGGSCANTVSTVALLGGEATLCGLVGTDELGQAYAKRLAETLGSHELVQRHGVPTGKCLSLVSSTDAERTMLTDLGAAMTLEPEALPVDRLGVAGWLHLTGYLFTGGRMGDTAYRALEQAAERDIKVSFDVGDPFVIEVFRDAVDRVMAHPPSVVFMNEEEGRALAGGDPLGQFESLLPQVETLVLKLGSRGSRIRHRGKVVEVEALRVEAVDTTGAGDTYAGGFLRGLSQGWGVVECGRLASAAAALTVSQVGGVVRDPELLRALSRSVASGGNGAEVLAALP